MKVFRIALLALLFVGLTQAPVFAAGFELPGFGSRSMGRGAAFVALANDPTAMFHNPGGLSKLVGTQLMINHNLVWAPITFTRAKSLMAGADAADEETALQPVSNGEELFPLNGSLFVVSDFGLDDWTFGLGVFGPNAVGKRSFPINGGQRYMLTRTEMLEIYYSLAVAYGKKDKYGFGITAQYVDVPLSKFSLVVDSTPGGQPSPYYNAFDLESTLDLSDRSSWTLLMGGWWRVSQALDLGVSGRVVPINLNLKGKVQLSKVSENFPGTLTLLGGDAAMDITMPVTARLGARYRHITDGGQELFDLEIDYVYEAWSSIEDYEVKLDGSLNLGEPTHGPVETDPGEALQDLTLGKKWRDTHSIRVGGIYNVIPSTLGLSLGGFWESGAVPNNYSNLDFLSFDRIGMGSGVQYSGNGFDLNLSFLYVMQEDRTVDERYGKVFQARPLAPCPEQCDGLTGVPANAGKIESDYYQLNMGLVMHFDQWFNDKEQ